MTCVEVPFNKPREQAVLLLAAADDLGLDQSVVRTTTGKFIVPQKVSDKAFKKPEPEETKPAKKSAAKKAPAKKTAKKK